MAARTAPATDVTGRKAAQLAKEAAQAQKDRAQEISMAHAAEAEINEREVVDVTGGAPVVLEEEIVDLTEDLASDPIFQTPPSSAEALGFLPTAPTFVDEEVVLVDADDSVVIRVAEDLEEVTIGEKTYDFTAGKKYKVEPNVAFVLRTAGKLYDRL